MSDDEKVCHDPADFTDGDGVRVHVTCQRLTVTAKGVKVEHRHHLRDLDIPGCSQARVSWTRRS